MKKIITLALLLSLFSSCKKDEKCKTNQAIELQQLNDQFQKETSNGNLNMDQIRELTRRYEDKKQIILKKCK